LYELLIPAHTLLELAHILPTEGEAQMSVSENKAQVLFHTEQLDLFSRLIEGTFPNFRQILPKEYATRAVVDTKELATAIRSVLPFASDSANMARLILAGEEEQSLQLEASAEDVGSNISNLMASVSGPAQRVILNAKHLAECVRAIHTSEIALEIESSARPVVLRPVGVDATYVLMPMSSNR
jgi:DNA polymerase-3 subunit beta